MGINYANFLFMSIFLVIICPLAKAKEYDLSQLYKAALLTHESIEIQKNVVKIAQESSLKANNSFLPTVNFSATAQEKFQLKQHRSDTEHPLTGAKVNLHMPLYRGGAEFALLSAAKTEVDAQQINVEWSKLQLFASLSATFVSALKKQKDIFNLNDILTNTVAMESELKKRVRIGRNRNGELLAARAQIATIKARIASAEADLKATLTLLSQLSAVQEEIRPVDNIALPPKPDSLDSFLNKLANRLDFRVLEKRILISKETVRAKKAGHFPNIDLDSNYYLKSPRGSDQGKWDVMLGLTLPLYDGGTVNSDVREMLLKSINDELELKRAKREAGEDLKRRYDIYTMSLKQIEALEESVRFNQANYREQLADYRAGIINYLDIVQAENSFQEAKQALDQASFNAKQAWVELNIAVGQTI